MDIPLRFTDSSKVPGSIRLEERKRKTSTYDELPGDGLTDGEDFVRTTTSGNQPGFIPTYNL